MKFLKAMLENTFDPERCKFNSYNSIDIRRNLINVKEKGGLKEKKGISEQ